MAPHAGSYQLEVWGAQGGNYNQAVGGKGAYVKGTLNASSGKNLYVYVGEMPTLTSASTNAGGWNGGGANLNPKPAGGGGATDISLRNGTWDSATHLYSRIIVAGGGGGGGHEVVGKPWNGGAGGAWNGLDGSGDSSGGVSGAVAGKGGTLSAGGAAGAGQNGAHTDATFGKGGTNYWADEPLGGGGGGWYGGGAAGGTNSNGGGGGGSSYAWSTSESLNTYYPSSSYKPTTSDYLTSLTKTAGVQTGHGKAQITYVKP